MLRRSFSILVLSRLRRSFWFLFTFFLFGVIVFTDRDAYPLFLTNPWRYVIIEDPLDFDVPLSKGNRFISVGEDGREVYGKEFPEEVMKIAKFMDDNYESVITTFAVSICFLDLLAGCAKKRKWIQQMNKLPVGIHLAPFVWDNVSERIVRIAKELYATQFVCIERGKFHCMFATGYMTYEFTIFMNICRSKRQFSVKFRTTK